MNGGKNWERYLLLLITFSSIMHKYFHTCGKLAWSLQFIFILQIAPKIKERMVMEGTMLIGYQPVGKFVNSFRFVTMNGDYVTKTDMDFVMKEIDRLGHDL